MAADKFSEQYRERLQRFSVSQRRELASRFEQAVNASVSQQHRGRLVACVVPSRGHEIDADDLRKHVRTQLSDYMVPQLILTRDALPRTAAGKLDRSSLQDIEVTPSHAAKENEIATPENEVEVTLANIWAEVLGLEEVSTHDNFFEVGGDSLLSIRILAHTIRAGWRISPEKFFAHPTIAEQARIAEPEGAAAAEQGVVTGHAPLIPIQRWFFENVTTTPQRWNQAPLYALSAPVKRLTLERAVQRLINHHDALRSRFIEVDFEMVQDFSQLPAEPPVYWVELRSDAALDQQAEIEAYAESVHAQIVLDQGQLARFVYFSAPGETQDYLLIIAHHLIIDAVSWRTVIEDLTTLLNGLEDRKAVALPRKTTPVKEWGARLATFANSDAITEQSPYWCGQRGKFSVQPDLSASLDENTVGSAFTVTRTLDPTLTSALIDQVPIAFRGRINDALLAAFSMALGKFAGAETIRFDLEGHGREAIFDDVDLSRTVGWLTTVYPVVLSTSADDSVSSFVQSVKEQLREIPTNGIGHGVLRYLLDDRTLKKLPTSDVLFNYLGRIDQASDASDRLHLIKSNVGEARAADGRRIYIIETNCRIQDGRLIVDWTASDRLHSTETIEAIADSYLDSIEQIVSAATSGAATTSPSDFPLADLDEEEMQNLAGMLEDIDDNS